MTPIKFNGSGLEYFKIWIVNILLTIVTLGLYRPWAKVRTLRYFYGNTELDNSNFEYHATGKQLFFSFIIAVALLVAYLVIGQLSPILGLILPIALLIALPWIIWRSMKFNLNMSSYRNVRFGFNGELSGSYIALLAYPIGLLAVGIAALYFVSQISIWLALVLSLIAYPAYFAMISKVTNSYVVNGSHFGQGQFSTNLEFKPFFMIILKAAGLAFLFLLIVLIIAFSIILSSANSGGLRSFFQALASFGQSINTASLIFGMIIFMYGIFILTGLYIFSYVKAHQRMYLLSKTTLNKSITFESTLTTNKYFSVMLTNLLLLVCTLGLGYPWAAVRLYRCSIESINVQAEEGFNNFISKQTGEEGPLGEELGDAFNADIGSLAF
ncbi:uncharacterized membrane protein YjgN (DUF898 family) [Marinomonas alcarazii]|uniref:Uncharacterized membrane protein YjgN (DUF898 family) n=1 Tax=Marinomonas alcarazii TaxID=491949 RepID=A0A318UT56_9GAMM|nr:YjgN family protein [Marinomonas alcarazii]PYF78348.1 uncharacterized membrane protein YjgN (DUF898 family) [Marinomonas alcarazii]